MKDKFVLVIFIIFVFGLVVWNIAQDVELRAVKKLAIQLEENTHGLITCVDGLTKYLDAINKE